jgi:hypothetical protein
MAGGDRAGRPRFFLDSGVLLEGLISPWSASRELLLLGRRGKFRLVLAEYVRMEVERNLQRLFSRDPGVAAEAISDYSKLVQLLRPERVPLPTAAEIDAHMGSIRHRADIAVLVSALNAAPTLLLTTNTRHFTPAVARRAGLTILSPNELIRRLRIDLP